LASQINASNSGFGGIVSTGDSSGVLQLQTANTTAVTIDTSQNVNIGQTSTPAGWGVQAKVSVKQSSASGGAGFLSFSSSNENAIFLGYDSTNSLGRIGVSYGSTGSFTPLAFETGGSERMRIDSSGNVLVGTTTPLAGGSTFATTANARFAIQNTNASPLGLYVNYSTAPNGTGNEYIYCSDTSIRMTVRSNGGIANFSANNVNLSDEREKKNIEIAGNYLDKICAIPVKTFLYNDQTDTDLNLGVIAQDVQAVAPELVSESNWGTEEEPKERLSIYQTDLQYALMKCIQEQQTIINDLKARIETLESK